MPRARSKPLPQGIYQRTHRSGRSTYSIDYVDAVGQRRQEAAGSSINAAIALRAKRVLEASQGHLPGHGSGAVTLDAYAVRAFAKRETKVRTVARERQLYRDHVAPYLGAQKLDDIAPADVERWIDTLTSKGELSPKSILNAHGVLSVILQRARFDRLIATNAARDLPSGTLPENVRTREVAAWTREEVEAFIFNDVLPEDRRIAYAIASFTGARLGEIAGMRWRDLDMASPTLWRWTLRTQYDGEELKTERPRDVPVHPELQELLERWRADGFPYYLGRHARPNDFVVPRQDGSCHSDNSLGAKAVHRHARRLGIDSTERDFHSFRRFMVTTARTDGARDLFLERVTHNAKGTMLDRYTYAGWGELCEAVACLRLKGRKEAQVVPLRAAVNDSEAGAPRDADRDASSETGRIWLKVDGGGGSRTPRQRRNQRDSTGNQRETGRGTLPSDGPVFPVRPALVPDVVARVTPAEAVVQLEALADGLDRAGAHAEACDVRELASKWRAR